ncbi:uncharacterized protein SPPG_08402 [Spizellomyces punctatus DAOM BR117]|uniref:Enkurin domain-containing protein n=1 Tax=Spizellomyces punctatus (strain DAOM BR117) TaxID=645134 RepID=A0A0L0H435_SPIPD|nr:uncharacterized protein SPPG_08402 [Spizellomyces punctatus DAOM BR117]KNC96250.1 hypothetical protein SPPG_08402 [Spizellomyces punctatus DAOM BR117]|eukprot:XP_016604290.1 hypothetical protein SPPG_08402 [Spizellomyces punctatus DAOM BR117]
MEARKTHLRHMAGTAVGMILKPSRGLRDDILRAGGKPKDHNKENRQRLKELEKANKAKKEETSKPSPPRFKLKQFEDVSSKLQTRRTSSVETLVSGTPESSRPSTANSSKTTESKKNFIHINAMKAKQPSPRTPRRPEPVSVERKTKKGDIPKYLVDRKLEWARKEQERLNGLEEEKIPSGMILVPEYERLDTLQALEKKQNELLEALSKFPVIIETVSMKKRKALIEAQLKEVEAAKEHFSRKTVYITKEDGAQSSDDEVETGVGVWDRARRAVNQPMRKVSTGTQSVR